MSCIYVLLCPITGAVRYVGKTDQPLEDRLKQHIIEAKLAKVGKRGEWLRSLIAQGLQPIIEHDADIRDDEVWQEVERERISYYLSIGCDLVNGTAGGEGLYKPTEAVLASMRRPHTLSPEGMAIQQANALRMAAGNVGSKRTPETRALMAEIASGRKASAETKAKMSVQRKGAAKSPEWKAAIALGRLNGKKRPMLTPEHRAKISAAGFRRHAKGPTGQGSPL